MGLRFLAVLSLMEGKYAEAEKLLGMSLRLFEKLEAHVDGYTLSVIAAMHYHGDIALRVGSYAKAGEHYRQCAMLCEDKGFYRGRGLGLNLTMSAWCALRLGKLEEAREYAARACPFFQRFQPHEGAGACAGEVAFGLSALFSLLDGEPQEALSALLRSDEFAKIIQKPLHNAIHFYVKAMLRELDSPFLEQALPQEADYYMHRARELFESLGFPPEVL
jgi:tetratricopeptide (TPR) repeat protein